MDEGNYTKAIKYYNSVRNLQSDSKSIANRGICYYEYNELSKAASDITKAFEMGNDDRELLLYMAKINHSKRNYKDAIYFYKKYLRSAKKEDQKDDQIILKIEQCFSGLKYNYESNEIGLVEPAGANINTKYDELNPVPSPSNPTRFYFSSNKKGNFDLYGAELNKGNWSQISGFASKLNSPEDEIMQDCSFDGSVLMFTRGNAYKDEYKVLINRDTKTKKNERYLRSKIKAERGDQDIHLTSDKLMIFASDVEGGYGGFDLYKSEHTSKGWSTPENLGSKINSPYDERTPFMTEDANTLYFSSNRATSIGGFDIFEAIKTSGEWQEPVNPSYPLNSPEDDLYFRIQAEGSQAAFSSNRKSGNGGYDIYLVFLKSPVQIYTTPREESIARMSDGIEESKKSTPQETDFVEKEIDSKLAANDKRPSEKIDTKDRAKVETSKKTEARSNTTTTETATTNAATNNTVTNNTAADNESKEKVEEDFAKDEDKAIKKKSEKEHQEIAQIVRTASTKGDSTKNSNKVKSIKENKKGSRSPEKEVAKAGKSSDKKKLSSSTKSSSKKKSDVASTKPPKKKSTSRKSGKKVTLIQNQDEIVLTPLFYSNDEEILSQTNQMTLDKVILALNKFPQSNLVLTCHSLPEGLPEFEMMFTIRRVERISQYLTENNIDVERIHLNSVGSAYPIVKKGPDAALYKELKQKNNRIDIKIVNADESIVFKLPEIEDSMKDNSYELYNTIIEDDVYFRVQIHQSDSEMYKNAVLRYYNDVFIEKNNLKQVYNFYVGLYPDFRNVFELKRNIENKYIDNPEIVAFYNGMKINAQEANLLKDDHPELKNYLDLLDDKYVPTETGSTQE